MPPRQERRDKGRRKLWSLLWLLFLLGTCVAGWWAFFSSKWVIGKAAESLPYREVSLLAHYDTVRRV
jgi:hypothetical protein